MTDLVENSLENETNLNFEEQNKDLLLFLRIFKKNINKNKKLEPKYFKKLSKIVRDGRFCEFLSLFNDFTNNESIVLGRAIMKNKIENVDEIIELLTSKKSKYHILILTSLLCKGRRFQQPVLITKYIKQFLAEESNVNFYRLILVACRKYKHTIDSEIIEFCEEKSHPILDEVIKEYSKENVQKN